jgi:hypothetical protein
LPSVYCLHEVFGDWFTILTKNIAGSSSIELPILFASIARIDTFVSIDDFDTFSIVSPITTALILLNMAVQRDDRSFATETMMINFSTDSGNKYIVCDIFQKNMEYNQQQYLSKIKIQREESKH